MTKSRLETPLSQTNNPDQSQVREDSNLKKVPILFCNQCDMSFKNRNKLNRHKREIHLKSFKIYHCSECDKRFKRKEHFIRHLKGKHQKDKYRCPLCPITYVERSRIRSHLVQEHDLVHCHGCSFYVSEGNLEEHSCDGLGAERTPDATLSHMIDCQSCKLCFLTLKDKEQHKCTKLWKRIFLDSKITEMVQNSSQKVPTKVQSPPQVIVNQGKDERKKSKSLSNGNFSIKKSTKSKSKVKKKRDKMPKFNSGFQQKNKKVQILKKTKKKIQFSDRLTSLNSEDSTQDMSRSLSILSRDSQSEERDDKLFEMKVIGGEQDNESITNLEDQKNSVQLSEPISEYLGDPCFSSLDNFQQNTSLNMNWNILEEMNQEEPGKLFPFDERLCRFDFEPFSTFNEDLEIPQFNMDTFDVVYNCQDNKTGLGLGLKIQK